MAQLPSVPNSGIYYLDLHYYPYHLVLPFMSLPDITKRRSVTCQNSEDTAVTPTEPDNSDAQFLRSHSASHISRLSDGTYCAGFPWKEEHPPLPNNLEVCQRCTRSLARRLAKSPGLLKIYDTILKE